DRTIVVERFRDELGDWRIVVHSPFGAQVHAPWALCVASRMRERYGLDVQAMHGDDGLVFRLPDTDWDGDSEPGGATPDELLELIFLLPDEVHDLVVEQIGGSALFASRFRECAGRALLLPKRRPDRRQALWQQRQRAAALLEVASTYPSFPIVLEAVRECVQDVFDVPGLVDLMRRIDAREIATVQVETPTPSPFAGSLMFGYVAQFLYEGDSPLAEKRAAALSLDPTLLGELLGTSEGLALRDLLDPAALTTTEAELQHLLENRRARDADDAADLLRVIGPLSQGEVARRVTQPELVGDWLAALEQQRRAIRVRVGDAERWAAIEDAGRLRDALGTSLPMGLPEAFLTTLDDPLGDLVARYARSHATFTLAEAAAWLGLGQAVVRDQVRRLVASGRVVEGELRPIGWLPSAEAPLVGDHAGMDFCDARVLRTLRRRSLASLRSEVEPVDQTDYARFLPAWQGVGGSMRGRDGLLRVVEQLSGVPLPASALETLVLPSRVRDYSPAMLDELTSSGEVLWQGHGAIAGADGWISLHLAELAPLTLTAEDEATGDVEDAVVQALVGGGAYFFRPLSDRLGLMDDKALSEAMWRLVWAGQLTNDTIAPLRAHLSGGTTTHKRAPVGPRQSRYGGRPGRLRGALPRPAGPPEGAGRWSLLPARELDVTARAVAASEVLLDRYGVLTRGSVASEGLEGGFSAVYKVLSMAEEAGSVRRGYFVSGLGAAQFGTVGAVDRLRAQPKPEATALVLAACDPANPWGASLAWPAHPGTHQPGRKAGAMVVSVEGALVLYVERGGRTLLSWGDNLDVLGAAAFALAGVVHAGHLGKLTVEKIDGGQVLGSDHPLARALSEAGFHLTPRGLRLRR
ncbi:MAG TPA: crosslink repair DNA glycosylase YcaQ family protein, partial [Propionibacteriaceae bacterium]|nr:crosslink repair DNA glycosylase YcaQ family protein [Propionibacteriaceae bacterium]